MKDNNDLLEQQMLLADCLIRISIMEKILISAGLVTQEQLTQQAVEISQKIIENMKARAQQPAE